MALSNRQRIEQGLAELKTALLPYVENELTEAAKGPRVQDVKQALNEMDLPVIKGKIVWDIQGLLSAMIKLWGPVFTHKFPRHESGRVRGHVHEANNVRNRYSHDMPFSYEDTYRDLDTLSRVADSIGAKEQTDKLRELAKAVMRVQFQEDARSTSRKAEKAAMEGTPLAALKPWREVIVPHPDVAKGKFLESEFVADLHAVHTGQAKTEYGEPIDFFARTFLTDGLRDLLGRSLERLANGTGSPVIELKTNFGGGKTHSLLALYHLFSDTQSSELPGLDPLLTEMGVDNSPKAQRVVIAGHQLGVNQPRKKTDKIEVKTLWGELAWQLGGADAYEKIRSSDESGTNPGAEVLADLMRNAQPCLILIDEWVTYLRDTVDQTGLAGGTFESNFGFAQSLTEAAKVVPNALVVASLPASRIEMGGSAGEAAFNQLENLFKRVATPWQPTRTEEGYEIVRRRLFESQIEYPARDAVVKKFYELYKEGGKSFPSNCSEQDYRRKLEACYPIHPELFDKLDAVWATLEKFQKTRGVLRLMAGVIAELWQREDKNLMIMPASVPLDSPKVANVINEVLPGGGSWGAVVASDIDGQQAVANVIDSDNSSLGKYSACRRVARTIFMTTAPMSGANRGVDETHLLLGCVQPGENADKFGDALRRLSDKATYLYRDASRSWFALNPSITRLAQDRAADYLDGREIDQFIFERLKKWQNRNVFPGGVSVAKDSFDLPDDSETRLVILPPVVAVPQGGGTTNEATELAEKLLTEAGKKPRTYRNALVFLAADGKQLTKLRESIATFRAWKSIQNDADSLELTSHDRTQVEGKVTEWDGTVITRLSETWSRILVPRLASPTSKDIDWQVLASNGSGSEKVATVLKKLKEGDLVYDQFSPFYLERELKQHLWQEKDHISTRQVAEAFASFLFFPRLLHQDLLIEAIRGAFTGEDLIPQYFGYADAFDEEAKSYGGLCTTKSPVAPMLGESVLIKPDVAMDHIRPPGGKPDDSDDGVVKEGTDDSETSGPSTSPPAPTEPRLPSSFFATLELDSTKAAMQFGDAMQEVFQHFTSKVGCKTTIKVEFEAEDETGFDESLQRTVRENSKTLGFDTAEFEE